MKQVYFRGISLAAALVILLSGAVLVQAAPSAQDAGESVVEIIQANEDLSALAEALATTGLDATLAEEGPFVVFAPVNAAIEALPEDALADVAAVTDLLLYHVVPGELDPASGVAATALGDELALSGEGEQLTVNGVSVGEAVAASNGTVYVIDSVLELPGEEAAADDAGEEDAAAADGAEEDAAAADDTGEEDAAAADGAEEDAAAADDAGEEDAAAADGAEEDAAAADDTGEEDAAAADGAEEDAAAADDAGEEDAAAADGADEAAAQAAPASADQADNGDDAGEANLAERSGRSRAEFQKVWKSVTQSRSMSH